MGECNELKTEEIRVRHFNTAFDFHKRFHVFLKLVRTIFYVGPVGVNVVVKAMIFVKCQGCILSMSYTWSGRFGWTTNSFGDFQRCLKEATREIGVSTLDLQDLLWGLRGLSIKEGKGSLPEM